MRVSRPFMLVAVVLSLGGCQTLTEELPTQVEPPPVQIPVLPPPVVPIPIPPPEPPGGGAPVPPPPSDPTGGAPPGAPPGQLPDNQNPVTKVGAKVFFVECDGQEVPGSELASEAPVGCRVHLDVTPKDASNKPTQVRQVPTWSFSNEGIIRVSKKQDFTPTFTAVGAGTVDCYAEADGLRSNTVSIRLK